MPQLESWIFRFLGNACRAFRGPFWTSKLNLEQGHVQLIPWYRALKLVHVIPPESHAHGHLVLCHLQKYLKEKATTKEREAAERERVRKAIKDDRQMHRFSHESRVLLPTPPSAERGSTRAGRGRNLPSPGMSSQQLSLSRDQDADDDDYDGLSDTQNESD